MQAFKPTDFLVARWLAIASAAGAAVAEVFAYFTSNPFWNTVGFVAALFAVAAVLGLWRAMSTRSSALVEAVSESGVQQQALQALHTELEIHRNLERELVEAKQTAESAVMAKGEFLATMSHEIRTPLNGIIPMLDLLMNSKLPPDQHEFLRTAYTSSRQMLRIVDDILDYSKLEANRLQLESTSFNLRELLDSIMRLMEKPAETKGLRLTLQLDPGVRLAVRGDPVRLRQVLTNLISNALKFTERGTVQLVVTRKGETRSQHELRFEVRDTGIGINPANAKNLFRAFAQADASTTRLYGGTGLGLVICKRIVDLMGGQIGVDSETGRGATFWFEIPLLKAVGDVQAQRSELSGGRLLLLSSDPALRQRMQQSAPAWGAQLSVSETTQDALHQLRSALTRGTSWSFDLLLVDLHSVRSTAIALHRNLQRSADFEHLPVAYLKGDDAPSPELSEGPQVLLVSRNMGSQEMRSALSTFIATPRTPRGGTAAAVSQADDMGIDTPSQVASSSNLHGRVLLVEDNPINQQVARSLIKILGLECETADNGEIALQRMAAGGIDLVLMDCQMPVKDGYSATREWRAVEAARNLPPLPIIAMTANAMAGDRQKCLEAGMDDYLSKPVDRRLLAFCLGRWLQRSPLRNAAQGAPAAPPGQRTTYIPTPTPVPGHRRPESLPTIAPLSPPIIRVDASVPVATPVRAVAPTAAITPAGPVIPILEMEVIEELRSIMGGEYQGLVKLFLEDAPVHIKRLQEAAAASDIAAMVAPAHTLKSSSANLGALALSAVAKRIESGARGEGLAKPTAAVLLLENEFRRAKAALMALSDH